MAEPIILTDSCCDLKNDFYKKEDIQVVSLTYMIGEKSKEDLGKDAEAKELYNSMRQGIFPSTSQINISVYKEKLKQLAALKRPVIYICFSSALSSSYSSACSALAEIKEEGIPIDCTILDSKSASLGQGLLVDYAQNMRKEGKDKEEIITWLNENIEKNNQWFTVDDLKYLAHGGRISNISAYIGGILNIKPVLWVDKTGRLIPVTKERGRKKAIGLLAQKLVERIENPERQKVFISHGDCVEDALYLKSLIEEKVKVKEVYINYVGPVIGSHSGPGTLALFFLGKPRTEENPC